MNVVAGHYCLRFGLFMFLFTALFQTCSCLYDYVCHENQIYKPHVKAYKDNRNGEPINLNPISTTNNVPMEPANGGGPNFYQITTNNTYICINGPAYLYFSKSTALGEVFETPKMEVYDHICDTYNVYPGKGATRQNITERLHAILLMGDATNYHAHPALQLFTAPYYDMHRKAPKGGAVGMYINATSLIVFGKQVCFIEKDNMPIRIKTIVKPADIDETEQHYCKLGYSKLLSENLNEITSDNTEKFPMKTAKKLLENVDFSIRNGGCSFAGYEQAGKTFEASFEDIKAKFTAFAPLNGKYDKPSAEDIAAEPKHSKKAKLEAQRNRNQKLKYIQDTINQILNSPIINDFKDDAPSPSLKEKIQTLIDKSFEAKKDRIEKHQNEVKIQLEKLELNRHPYNYNKIKNSIAEPTAGSGATVPTISEIESNWDAIVDQMKNGKKALAKLEKLFIEIQKKKPLANADIDNAIAVAEFETSLPVTIEFSVVSEDCKRMHKSTETCAAAKPNPTEVCDLFKNSLGHAPPDLWKDTNKWKGDLLDTMADIFNNACFRLPKKFTRNVHRIFKHYLTNPKIFNKKTTPPNASPTTAAETPGGPPPASLIPTAITPNAAPDLNEIEKPFWRHIKTALAECKKNMQRLFIRPPPPNNKTGDWKLKRNNENIKIVHHNEQAELEYTFNWVIDWQYKIFATVLGLCMPAYESKLPLITSRFYSLYTEAFIIPLRETWVNSKDNKVFHWILGEFKHHDADLWVKNCMEAAFLQHKKVEYRPPRCVLVNGYKEHNYYISGTFPYGHKGRYAK